MVRILREFKVCQQVEISSDLEFNILALFAVIMKYSSQRLQRFVLGEYDCAYFRIFQVI